MRCSFNALNMHSAFSVSLSDNSSICWFIGEVGADICKCWIKEFITKHNKIDERAREKKKETIAVWRLTLKSRKGDTMIGCDKIVATTQAIGILASKERLFLLRQQPSITCCRQQQKHPNGTYFDVQVYLYLGFVYFFRYLRTTFLFHTQTRTNNMQRFFFSFRKFCLWPSNDR